MRNLIHALQIFIVDHLSDRRRLLIYSLIIWSITAIFCLRLFDFKDALLTMVFGYLVNLLATISAIAMGADIIQKKIEAAARRLSMGKVGQFWTSGPICHFRIYADVRNVSGKRSISFDTMCALSQITATLTQVHGDNLRYEVLDAQKLTSIDELKKSDSHIILLGGDIAIPLTVEILKEYNTKHYQHCSAAPRKIKRALTNSEYVSVVQTQGNDQLFVQEFGLITRIPIKKGKRCWFIISGNHGIGTYLASLAVSDQNKFPSIDKIPSEPIQALISGELILRSTIPDSNLEVLSVRDWEVLQ